MFGLENLVRQLRHLTCRIVSLTTLIFKRIRSSIILLVVYVDHWGVIPKVYYLLNPFFKVSFTQRIC